MKKKQNEADEKNTPKEGKKRCRQHEKNKMNERETKRK